MKDDLIQNDVITERISINLSSHPTVKHIFNELGLSGKVTNYLVTINNERITALKSSKDIVTTPDQPLIFQMCSCWVLHEMKMVPQYLTCESSTKVQDLQHEEDTPQIAFHEGKRIDSLLPIWKLDTSRKKPLTFRSAQLKVSIDEGPKFLLEESFTDISELVQAVARKKEVTLCNEVADLNGIAVDSIDNFILVTHLNKRHLCLRSYKPEPPLYNHSVSISKSSRKDIEKYSDEYEVYKHWLSLKVYDNFCCEPSEEARTFSQELIKRLHQKPEVLDSHESSYTSMFFQALDRYLVQEGDKTLCVLHQPVFAKDFNDHKNKPDGCIFQSDGGVLSQYPVLVSDFKNEDYEKAVTESLGYFQCAATVSRKLVPMLVMPATKEKLSLFLCWPKHKTGHATIKILEEIRTTEFAAFFNALKVAVNVVCKVPEGSFKVEPLKDFTLTRVLKLPNVYRHNNHVVKLFDTNSGIQTNIDLVTTVLGDDYLDGIKAQSLTTDQRYQLLEYKYICGSSGPRAHKVCDLLPVARTLQKLHDHKYVHSDVRLANIVFMDNNDSKLIDFDLADRCGSKYPFGYNSDFLERHPSANQCSPRNICHDRYSLFYLVKQCEDFCAEKKEALDKEVNTGTDLLHVLNMCTL